MSRSKFIDTGDHKISGFNSFKQQSISFQNLLAGFNPEYNSILDTRSGCGDLYAFIQDFWDVRHPIYTGYESDHLNVVYASNKNQIKLETKNFSADTDSLNYDWVVSSKPFDTVSVESLFQLIDNMVNFARIAVSLNLVNYSTEQTSGYIPGSILQEAILRYQTVALKHNFSNQLFNLTIYKRRNT